MFLEHLRRPLRADTDLELLERMPADANSVHTTEEPDRYDHLLDCLDCCLEKLDPQDRELILDYYIGEHRAKIESRRNTGAEKNLEQSLALSKQVAEGREEQALALSGLGVLYTRKEDYAKAEELLQRSLDMTWELFGSDHPNVALCLMNIATMHANRGELQRALSEMERAVAINGKALEPDDPSAIRVLDAMRANPSLSGRLRWLKTHSAPRLHDPNWVAVNVNKEHCLPAPVDKIAGLTRLAIAGAVLNPAFKPDVKTYMASVAADVTTIDVIVEPTSMRSSAITVNGEAVKPGAQHEVRRMGSRQKIQIHVASPDGKQAADYTVTLQTPQK